jgi:hypothetical protein
MTALVPVTDQRGQLWYVDQWGNHYMPEELDPEERIAAQEVALSYQRLAAAQEPEYDEEPEEADDTQEWDDESLNEFGAVLEAKAKKYGREFTPTELSRFADQVNERGDIPQNDSSWAYNLDDDGDRRSYMDERLKQSDEESDQS